MTLHFRHVKLVIVATAVALLVAPVFTQTVPLSNFQFMVIRVQSDRPSLRGYVRERFEREGWRFTSSGAQSETLYCDFVFNGAERGGGSVEVLCQNASGLEIISLFARSGDYSAFTLKGNYEHATRNIVDQFRELRPARFRPFNRAGWDLEITQEQTKEAARSELQSDYYSLTCEDPWITSEGHLKDLSPWVEEFGLRRGDRLLAINGVEIDRSGDFVPAMLLQRDGDIEVRVERAGREFLHAFPCREPLPMRAAAQALRAMALGNWEECVAEHDAFDDAFGKVTDYSVNLKNACRLAAGELTAADIYEEISLIVSSARYSPRLPDWSSEEELLERMGAVDVLSDARDLIRDAERSRDTERSADFPGNRTDPEVAASLMQGSGTAFVVHPDGLLLTAQHVIDRATSITVACNGGPTVPVTVASSSPTIDLAVLTTTADLGTDTFLQLSPGQQPRLGDPVFTVGYPTPGLLGRDPKYTNGTVSALSGPGGDASFLQISVPIQPGNSGGPLVNAAGDVIGVVVATADAPTFIEVAESIPQNINWAVKSVFASALFTPPTGQMPSIDPDEVIQHVTEATCLVEATRPAR